MQWRKLIALLLVSHFATTFFYEIKLIMTDFLVVSLVILLSETLIKQIESNDAVN